MYKFILTYIKMSNKYIKMLENYPIGVLGTVLGFITLSNVYAAEHVYFLKPIATYCEIFFVFIMFLRLITFPKSIGKDLQNHIAGCFYATIDMGLFLVGAYFQKSYPGFVSGMWICLVALHVILICIYSFFRLKNRKFKEIVPSWYVTYVGIATGAMTSVALGFDYAGKIIACFATLCYLSFYLFMLYKIFFKKFDDMQITTVGIMGAPGGLVVGALVTVFSNVNEYFLWFLVLTMFFNLIIVYYFMCKLFTRKFNPGLAAFTFPLAVSALATYKLDAYLLHHHMWGVKFFKVAGLVELVVASVIIAYVSYKYFEMFFRAVAAKSRA